MSFFKTILKGVNDLFGPSIQPNSSSSNMTELSDPGEAWSEPCSDDEEKAVQKLINIVSSANYKMEVSGWYNPSYTFYFPEYKLTITENYCDSSFGNVKINDKSIPLKVDSLIKIWKTLQERRRKERDLEEKKEKEEALETVLSLSPQIKTVESEKPEREIFTKIAAILREDNFQKEKYKTKGYYGHEIFVDCYRFQKVKLTIARKIGEHIFSLGDDSLMNIFTTKELSVLNKIWNVRLFEETQKEKLAIEENILKVTAR